jgi:alpha-1,2-mannosyltransferase
VVAFFHPHCSAGGGGERVLWKAVQVLGDLHDQGLPLKVVIYTIGEPKASYKEGMCLCCAQYVTVSCLLTFLTCIELLRHVQERFSIAPSSSLSLTFVHLQDYAHFLGATMRSS